MNRTCQLTSLALLGFVLTACDAKDADPSGQGEGVGLPNPAAVYCEEQGGQYNLDTGKCTLADGSEVDAWEYFRSQNPSG